MKFEIKKKATNVEYIYVVLSGNNGAWRAFRQSSREEMEEYINRLTREFPQDNFYISAVQLF